MTPPTQMEHMIDCHKDKWNAWAVRYDRVPTTMGRKGFTLLTLRQRFLHTALHFLSYALIEGRLMGVDLLYFALEVFDRQLFTL